MRGRKITGEALENIRRGGEDKRSRGIYKGERNPFYGKKHPKEIVDRIHKKRKIAVENWTDEQKLKNSESQSKAQQKMMESNPEEYIRNKIKAGRASSISQKSYKKNKIELIVEEEFKKIGLFPSYSVILGYFQYDFGFKEHRILLEAQGDYWHANPDLFNSEGTDGKRKINEIQRQKIEKDKEKLKFAIDNDLKIFYIWESDIIKNNFKTLNDIKNEIQNNSSAN